MIISDKGGLWNDKDSFRVPGQHLPQPHGRVYLPRYARKARLIAQNRVRVGGHERRGGGQSRLPARAVQLTRGDYDRYDLLVGMEERNIAAMKRICGGDPENKIHRLLDGAPHPRDIADPWYTGDFDAACRDITEGCARLIDRLAEGRAAY